MTRPSWQRIRTERAYEHPRVPIVEDTVLLVDGNESRYAILGLPDAVTVIIKRGDHFLLNLEYAYPVDDRIHRPDDVTCDGWLYKFPGGMLLPGEDYEAGGLRETVEETGHTIGNLILLGAVRNYFPRSNSRDYKLLAEITGEGTKNRDREEADMQQHWLTAGEIDKLIAGRDPRVMFAHFFDTWQLYKTRTKS